jgi:chromosome segregation ATPase
MQATLRGLSDLRTSVNSLSESVQNLESSVNTRETDLDTLQSQITANVDSLLAIQQRLDELESIPANSALANRIADAELELATVSATLDRLRLALGMPASPAAPTTQEVPASPPAATPTP